MDDELLREVIENMREQLNETIQKARAFKALGAEDEFAKSKKLAVKLDQGILRYRQALAEGVEDADDFEDFRGV